MRNIDISSEMILVILWVAMFGIIENIINIYVPSNDYIKRIIIYILMLFIAIILIYL